MRHWHVIERGLGGKTRYRYPETFDTAEAAFAARNQRQQEENVGARKKGFGIASCEERHDPGR